MAITDDFTDASLQSAIDEWADALGRYAEQATALDDEFQAEVTRLLGESEGHLADFEQVCVGSEVWAWGGWHRVVTKTTATDEHGRQDRELVLVDEGHPSWVYPVLEGERLTIRWAF